MKIIVWICRIIIGSLFVFSGFVKAVDPWGMAYKMEEYFEVFHLTFFVPYSLWTSVLMNALEIFLGVFTIIGYRMKITSWLLLILMAAFLYMTGYSAITNKVTDCGCFGDFLKISTWATFYKNVIFIILIIPIFLHRNKIQSIFSGTFNELVAALTVIASVGMQYYCIEHLPLLDFRAYKVGNNIREQMSLKIGEKPDSVSTALMYKDKISGEEKGYTMATLPWQDSIWMANHEFVRQENIVVRKGAEPKIKDFKVWDDDNIDLTSQVLDSGNLKIWIVAYDINKTDKTGYDKIVKLVNDANKEKISIIGLTSTAHDILDPFKHDINLALPFYYADGTVLKTMIRANPGIMVLDGPKVLAQYHYNDTPSLEEVKKLIK